jgi:plastocyanin
MIRVRVAALILAGFGVLVLAGSVLAANASVSITEASGRYRFGPATVYTNVGQTVTWTNNSDAPHTVTSNSGTELASSNINAGGTFSHSFGTVGTFAYHCTIHTYMRASVIVLAAGVTPPPSSTVGESAAQYRSPPTGLFVLIALGLGLAVSLLYVSRRRA